MNKAIKLSEYSNDTWNYVDTPSLSNEQDYFNHHLKKYDLVKKIIEEKNPERILDIGAGSGIFYSLLPNFSAYELHAVEYASDLVNILKKRGIRAKQCNIEKECIPYDDNFFDLIVCDSIIEHTLNPRHLITEIERVMKQDASLILVAPNATSLIRRWNHLRGRNLFEPVIDNLLTKDYLKRCSIFYAEAELRRFLGFKNLVICQTYYLNEISHDPKKILIKMIRMLGFFIPRFRDVIVVVSKKG